VFGISAFLARRRAQRHPIPTAQWTRARRHQPYAQRLDRDAQQRLRALAALFLQTKTFATAHGLTLTPAMRTRIALSACLPVLNLGLEYYAAWRGIVVYPGDFRARREFTDEHEVVHTGTEDLCGESLTGGPMVLSWDAITHNADYPGQDLVIHECAHKLDILNGDANGMPPLHTDMSPRVWSRALRRAFDTVCEQVERGQRTAVDDYAATDPAEFFAVVSESFFTVPLHLQRAFPEVYEQLARFYRQDPATRFAARSCA
jgi:hypothetical protein